MRNGYRHPAAGIVLMGLVFGLITVVFVITESIVPFAGAVAMLLGGAAAAASGVMLILFALGRTGVHRLAEVRTWPQD